MTLALQGVGMTSQRTRDRLIEQLRGMKICSNRVLEVMRHLPRHLFVDEALSSRAYENSPLPIGYGQTISQPYVVARMSEVLLSSGPLNKVLEIGTGSGYQTAILSLLATEVYSVERVEALLDKARSLLHELEARNVRLRLGDGCAGWQENAPYDAIIITAATEKVPDALFSQLIEKTGRIVAPVGASDEQNLLLITMRSDGLLQRTHLNRVKFVPLLNGIQNSSQ